MSDNMVILMILACLCGLFLFRSIRNKKLYDVLVLVILVIGGISKTPIGKNLPQSLIITIALGLGVVIVLLYIKDKSDSLKKAMKSNNENDSNS